MKRDRAKGARLGEFRGKREPERDPERILTFGVNWIWEGGILVREMIWTLASFGQY